jgi:hypothetical protein
MNSAQIDLQQLRIKHILYKSKVRSVLYGGTFDETFFSPAGPVSIWINKTCNPKYGNEPEMRELVQNHQEMNSTALRLFKLYNSGQIDQAHDGFKNIELQSEIFLNLLSRLEEKLT